MLARTPNNMTPDLDYPILKRLALELIDAEASAVLALKHRIDKSFCRACQEILDCEGRIVVIGMGKSGHIGGKIAATLASTGSPAFFVHPGEASHGDLGMITRQDIVIALSNSGQTPEILTILPLIKRLGIPLISMTGNPQSTLAQNASVNLNVSVEQEACPLGLAPTTSTTVALVMGDALAIALLQARGFTRDDFALSHPGGNLGRRLLLTTEDLMHTGSDVPKVSDSAFVSEALLEMTAKKLGMTAIVNNNNQVLGLFTDGDLRRMFEQTQYDIHTTVITTVMTAPCITIRPNILAAEALKIMEDKKITALLTTTRNGQLIGALHMHDLLRAGII